MLGDLSREEAALESDEQRRLEAHFGGLADADLRRITTLERSQYREEAFQMALDELARRRLPLLLPEDYWRQFQEEWLAQVGFCYKCWTTTTDESLGAVFPGWRLIGVRLVDEADPCPACNSVVLTKSFCIAVPIVSMGRYRVLLDRRLFADPPKGRRLRDDATVAKSALRA